MDGSAQQRPAQRDGLPDDAGYVSREWTVGPWLVSATWLASLPGSGPVRVAIEPHPEASPEEFRRGLTSGALRGIEGEVVKATTELAGQLAPAVQAVAILAMWRDAMRPYKDGKPVDANYYTLLLGGYDGLTKGGDKTPVQSLAALLGRKPETIRTQLKKARKLAADQTEGN